MTNPDISAFISKLKAQKNVKVKVKGKHQTSPKPLAYNGSRRTFIPDIVAVYPKKHDYYAVEKKITKSNLPELIGKWILFALHARLKSGKFFLIVTGEQDAKRCREIIKTKQLAVELIVI